MLQITDLDYRIGARTLFTGASVHIASGWKVGLVGQNGTGKSTLLRLIRESITSDDGEGTIALQNGARLGWVDQEVPADEQKLLDVVLAADGERQALLDAAETETDPIRVADLHTRLVDIEAWSGEARASTILMGLGFTPADLDRPTRMFSGGWRMRAAMAGVLFARPDLLLLDEPTNYLDLEGAAWLEAYLKHYPHTVIMVSHDRDMLNRCVTHIMALEHQALSVTPGGYDEWLTLRAAKLAQLESLHTKQAAERAHLQAFVDRFRYKASKARQAQSRLKMLERMQAVSIPVAERTTPFHFSGSTDTLAPPLLELRAGELGYGLGASILKGVDLRLDPDDRVAIIGTNGQGKTTLVKSIAGRLALMSGERFAPGGLRIGYFSQDQMDELTLGDTVLDHVRRALPVERKPAEQRSMAAKLGFSEAKVDTRVDHLSGGEKVRLLLGLMGLQNPHILVLDEPTSHLDIDSREALIYALNAFPGAVLLITHDVYLAGRTADRLWLVKDGAVRPYDGDLGDYRAMLMQANRGPSEESASAATGPAPSPMGGQKVDKVSARRRASEKRREAAPLKRRAEAAEKVIEDASRHIETIDMALLEPVHSSEEIQALMQARAKAAEHLLKAEAEWLEASEAYEALLAAN